MASISAPTSLQNQHSAHYNESKALELGTDCSSEAMYIAKFFFQTLQWKASATIL
jgi:hypothetical protein